MTARRSPIPATIALALASWIGVAYVMPAAQTLRQVGQEIDGQQTTEQSADTYDNGGK